MSDVPRLWHHRQWSDTAVLEALRRAPDNAEAWREYAHILGAESVWLARLRGETPKVAVWPELTLEEATVLGDEIRVGYEAILEKLDDAELERSVAYVNSAGQAFENRVGDILLHVMLHGQYHRGKINLLLRQAGAEPSPVDFIAWRRGVAAATTR